MKTLNAKDERIADLFSAGAKAEAIASDVGCSAATVYRRLRHPLVKARIAEQRAAVLRPVIDVLREMMQRAAAVVGEILDDPETPAALRLKAAEFAFSHFRAMDGHYAQGADIAALQAIAQESDDNQYEYAGGSDDDVDS
jgi:hypothetical protein